jgi:hypothetical protein
MENKSIGANLRNLRINAPRQRLIHPQISQMDADFDVDGLALLRFATPHPSGKIQLLQSS